MPRSASSIRHIVRNLKLEYEGCSLEDIIRDRKIILLYIDDLEVDGAYGKFDIHFGNGVSISKQFIFINSKLDYYKRSCVLAHELGHAILHPDINTIDQNYKPVIADCKIEMQAEIFASEFLLDDDSTLEYINLGVTNINQAKEQCVPVKYVDLKRKNLVCAKVKIVF